MERLRSVVLLASVFQVVILNGNLVSSFQSAGRSTTITTKNPTSAGSKNKFLLRARDATRDDVSVLEKDTVNGSGGGLMAIGESLQSQLASAFSALDESSKYDAVLTGLCAKVLDEPANTGAQAAVALQDPIQLVQEMNMRNVKASPRSMMALIDASVTTQDATLVNQIVSLCARNGAVQQFGNLQAEITPLPVSPDSKVRCPDGSTKTRRERLEGLPDVPVDERGSEVTSALAVASVVGFCGTVNVLGIDEISPFTTTVWFLLVTVGLLDNFYNGLKFGLKTFAKDQAGNLPEDLPLSLGSGQVSGTVIKGFNRLLQVDTERECECEAASFFAAYALGLPSFSFRPNALEAAVLVAESSQPDNDINNLLTANGIMKMLVWLMAPVAMENSKHAQLIQSDPREAEGFLTRLENSELIDRDELWWLTAGYQEKEDMLKWAYTEADILIRRNKALVTEISQRLTGGSATVADCVAAMENW